MTWICIQLLGIFNDYFFNWDKLRRTIDQQTLSFANGLSSQAKITCADAKPVTAVAKCVHSSSITIVPSKAGARKRSKWHKDCWNVSCMSAKACEDHISTRRSKTQRYPSAATTRKACFGSDLAGYQESKPAFERKHRPLRRNPAANWRSKRQMTKFTCSYQGCYPQIAKIAETKTSICDFLSSGAYCNRSLQISQFDFLVI